MAEGEGAAAAAAAAKERYGRIRCCVRERECVSSRVMTCRLIVSRVSCLLGVSPVSIVPLSCTCVCVVCVCCVCVCVWRGVCGPFRGNELFRQKHFAQAVEGPTRRPSPWTRSPPPSATARLLTFAQKVRTPASAKRCRDALIWRPVPCRAAFGALEDANEALKLDPVFVKAYYRRATANMGLRRWKAAKRDYEAVLQVQRR